MKKGKGVALLIMMDEKLESVIEHSLVVPFPSDLLPCYKKDKKAYKARRIISGDKAMDDSDIIVRLICCI